jgi:hypothetical protein
MKEQMSQYHLLELVTTLKTFVDIASCRLVFRYRNLGGNAGPADGCPLLFYLLRFVYAQVISKLMHKEQGRI